MQEYYLHYIWQFQYFDKSSLSTTQGDSLTIIYPGTRNEHAGPDFLDSHIIINGIAWHGHVEVHVKASDWNAHKHYQDPAYDNVILHVVWEDNQPIEREDHTLIPTLALNGKVDDTSWDKYQQLINSPTHIPCAPQFHQVDKVTQISMLDQALFQRLNNKFSLVNLLLANNKGDWDQTAYNLLAINFGFKINSPPFTSLSLSLPNKIMVQRADDLQQLEALLFGQAGLLPEAENQENDTYTTHLIQEYQYLRQKYQLTASKSAAANWKFFRLRPANFPTIRIAQFAQLLHQHPYLFRFLIHTPIQTLKQQLSIQQSPYWQNHYQFNKPSKTPIPGLGKDSVANILINTVVPLLVAYSKSQAEQAYLDRAVDILQHLPPEHNHITRYWEELGIAVNNSFDSQAVIQLYNNFCSKKRCLECKIGNKLLQKNGSTS